MQINSELDATTAYVDNTSEVTTHRYVVAAVNYSG